MSSMDQLDALTAAIRAAPELQQSPGVALAVSQTPSPAANAQAAGLGLQSQAITQASQQFTQTTGHPPHKPGGLFGFVGQVAHDISSDVIKPIERQRIPGTDIHPAGPVLQGVAQVMPGVGAAASQAMQIANMPLAEVQHNYRYLHDVWQRHGPVPAIAEALGIVGTGAAVAGLTDSRNLGVLAGEAAGAAEGQVFYRDSWARTQNGNAYRDASGQLVSPGRDVANLLTAVGVPVGRAGAAHGIVSGAVDALFDMATDPLARVGGIYGEAKGGGALGQATAPEGTITNPFTGNKLFVGTALRNPGDAEMLYDRANRLQPGALQFKRAVGWMADHSPSEIAAAFPPVTQVPGLAARLGEATTDQQVLNVLEDQLAFQKALVEGRLTPLHILNPMTGTTTEVPRSVVNPYTGMVTNAQLTKPLFFQGAPTMSSFDAVSKGALDKLREAPVVGQRLRSLEKVPESLKVPVVGDTGAEALRRYAAQGVSPRLGNDLIDAFLNTNDIEERRRIVKALGEAVVLGRGGIDEEEIRAGLLQKVRARLDAVTGGEKPEGEYGVNPDGTNLSKLEVRDPTGAIKATVGAAIWRGQTSDTVGILGYNDVKDLSQMIRGYRGVFAWPGQVDDFAWDHFTKTWRKLALLTGGFAYHITAAEDLLNGARHGFIPLVDAAIRTNVANLGFDVATEEKAPIRALVYRMIGSPTADKFDAIKNDPAFIKEVDLATHMAIVTGGSGLTPELSATWVFPTSGESPVETARTAMDAAHAQLPRGQKFGDTYKVFTGSDPNAPVYWAQQLNFISGDPTGQAAAKAYGAALSHGLDDQEASRRALAAVESEMRKWSPEERQLYMRSTQTSIEGLDPNEAFARTKVEGMKGMVTGQDGNVHPDLVARVANGDFISHRDLEDILPGQRPSNIPGRELLPNPDGRIDRLANLGHEKVIGPLINTFARRPTFYLDTRDALKGYQSWVDQGLIDQSTAMNWAMQDASQKTIRFIHNPQERLQATETFRNIAPFAFAQVQAYKRFGRLLMSDPGAFRRMQLVLTGMTDLANRAKDPNGIQQAVYPGSGYVTHGMLAMASMLGMSVTSAVPVSFAGSTSALQAVDPFMQGTSGLRPSMGPLVSVAAHLIDNFDPRATQIVTSIVGSQTANESLLNIIPNTPIRHLIEGAIPPTPGLLRSNDSIWLQTLANLDYAQNKALTAWYQTPQYQTYVANGGDPSSVDALAHGRPDIVPPPGASSDQRQAFVDKVRNQSRFVRLVQAVMSEVTPASPQAVVGNKKIPAEFQKMVTAEGLDKAYVDFAVKYPDAGPLIQSMSDVKGGVLAASAKAMDWVHTNQGFVNANKDIASFFVPQNTSDQYSPSAYNEQLAMGLRTRKTPQEFQNDFYVNTGWADYDLNRAAYEQALKQSGAAVLYPGDAAHPATYSSAGQSGIVAAWDQFLATFKAQNPAWAAAYDSPDNTINARQGYNQLVSVLDSGRAPASPQVDVLKNMVAQYQNYVSALTPGANGNLTPTSAANRPVTEAWSNFLKDTAVTHPEYAPVINKIFRWLTPLTPQG